MRPHKYHTILLPLRLTRLKMNLFASCTPWFPRIHVSENREVSPFQNSTRSDSKQISVERLLSEKHAALSEKSAANFQKKLRAANMELLVHRENSSCGTRAALSSQSISFPLTRRAQVSMWESQVFTLKLSGRLIPVSAPVATQRPVNPTAAFSDSGSQSAREALPIVQSCALGASALRLEAGVEWHSVQSQQPVPTRLNWVDIGGKSDGSEASHTKQSASSLLKNDSDRSPQCRWTTRVGARVFR